MATARLAVLALVGLLALACLQQKARAQVGNGQLSPPSAAALTAAATADDHNAGAYGGYGGHYGGHFHVTPFPSEGPKQHFTLPPLSVKDLDLDPHYILNPHHTLSPALANALNAAENELTAETDVFVNAVQALP